MSEFELDFFASLPHHAKCECEDSRRHQRNGLLSQRFRSLELLTDRHWNSNRDSCVERAARRAGRVRIRTVILTREQAARSVKGSNSNRVLARARAAWRAARVRIRTMFSREHGPHDVLQGFEFEPCSRARAPPSAEVLAPAPFCRPTCESPAFDRGRLYRSRAWQHRWAGWAAAIRVGSLAGGRSR